MTLINSDRLFPVESNTRDIARELYNEVKDLPIISPHGHTDPAWYAENINFTDPTSLFIIPDHYLVRMFCSIGFTHGEMGVPTLDGTPYEKDTRLIWKRFAENFYLFRGTPSYMWLTHVFSEVFGIEKGLSGDTSNYYYDVISDKISSEEFKVRNLFEKFNIEIINTTDEANDDLRHHQKINNSDWNAKVLPCFRPDSVVDPLHPDFKNSIQKLGEITGEEISQFKNYLNAIRKRREYFKAHGATSTDHASVKAYTVRLSENKCQQLLVKAIDGSINAEEAEQFLGHMLIEMAGMSVEDGLVMQLHPGVLRNHSQAILKRYGKDKGVDIPVETEYVRGLKPLLDLYGHEKNLKLILFTLDDTRYTRELAPLAGYYPILKLGPSWWFNDSPEGMMKFRESVTETAGFYNTVGFNDDTRAFLSIPARHDVARRIDASFLARLVCEHRITLEEARQVIKDLAYKIPKESYNLS